MDFNQTEYDYYIYAEETEKVTPNSVLLEKGLLKVADLITEQEYTQPDSNTEYTFI